jgi:hypothetical protein
VFEFFLGVDRELGDTELVSLSCISVVGFNVFQVSFEDEFSVGLFSGFEGGSEIVFPLGEGIDFS